MPIFDSLPVIRWQEGGTENVGGSPSVSNGFNPNQAHGAQLIKSYGSSNVLLYRRVLMALTGSAVSIAHSFVILGQFLHYLRH